MKIYVDGFKEKCIEIETMTEEQMLDIERARFIMCQIEEVCHSIEGFPRCLIHPKVVLFTFQECEYEIEYKFDAAYLHLDKTVTYEVLKQFQHEVMFELLQTREYEIWNLRRENERELRMLKQEMEQLKNTIQNALKEMRKGHKTSGKNYNEGYWNAYYLLKKTI